MDALISGYVKNGPTAFYAFDEYTKGIKNLVIFAEDRAKSIVAQLNDVQASEQTDTLPTILDISALGRNGFCGRKGREAMPDFKNGATDLPNTQNEDAVGIENLEKNKTKQDTANQMQQNVLIENTQPPDGNQQLPEMPEGGQMPEKMTELPNGFLVHRLRKIKL